MYGAWFPVIALTAADFARLDTGDRLRVALDGRISSSGP
jgi:hypothetical protein